MFTDAMVPSLVLRRAGLYHVWEAPEVNIESLPREWLWGTSEITPCPGCVLSDNNQAYLSPESPRKYEESLLVPIFRSLPTVLSILSIITYLSLLYPVLSPWDGFITFLNQLLRSDSPPYLDFVRNFFRHKTC